MVGARISLEDVIDMDYEAVAVNIADFIERKVIESGADGVVVGVSGGVDSATTLALAVKAVNAKRVLALIMPDTRTTPREDVNDAVNLVRNLGVNYNVIYIDNIVDSFSRIPDFDHNDYKSIGNIRARIRMILLYYYANHNNLIVLGTGDRSEFLIGYFTKYGDGAADIYPISVLYKSQVRRLALHLGVPEKIAYKPSSPRLWPGHMAEKELGLSYEVIDVVLFSLFDLGLEARNVCEATGITCDIVNKVLEMHKNTMHKRSCFTAPDLRTTVKPYWKGLARLKKFEIK